MAKPYQLFAANQTLVCVSRRPRRFKPVEPGFLPVFGKPVHNTPDPPRITKNDTDVKPDCTYVANQTELPLFGSVQPVATNAGSPVCTGIQKKTQASEKQLFNRERMTKPRWSWVWNFVHRTWGKLARVLRARKLRRPRPGESAQGELALSTVKVIRNDLTDADIEVIPVTKEHSSITGRDRTVIGGSLREVVLRGWGLVTRRSLRKNT